ncbi:MAG: 50S ribosomal protein L29 [Candidatus Moranbacteria bacterium]|jgi:ribosomal protein L29|nr:50S ribosomal protein L29 [Candidatus Moranbacteria bacterium]NTW90174.1 50S ribosomal protein L29 [Candidatus Moranbacteria bacterium]
MKMKELREKSQGEREKLLLDLRTKVRELRFSVAGRETKNHREYRALKKDVARVMTLGHEEELNA